MKNPYEILGLNESCSFEELKARYEQLKNEYSEGRFRPGEEGNEAARKLREAAALMKEGLRDLPGPDDLCVVCQVPRALFPMLFLADIERIPTNRTTPEAAPVPSELASRLLHTHLENVREKYRKLVL